MRAIDVGRRPREIGFAGPYAHYYRERRKVLPGGPVEKGGGRPRRRRRLSHGRAFTKLPYAYETIPSAAHVAKKVHGKPCVAIYLSNTI